MNKGEDFHKRWMEIAVRLDQKLYGKKDLEASPSQALLEFIFNLLGIAVGLILSRYAPPEIGKETVARMSLVKSKRPAPPLHPESQAGIEEIQALQRALKSRTGREPAVFLAMSHPDTSTEKAYVLGDLLYHASQISDALFPRSRLLILQAIDAFALDTLPLPVGAAYAGFMFSGHIAIDRMPSTRVFPQNILFRSANHYRTIHRMVQCLKSGNVLCAAIGGGVVHNARILYTFREIAQTIYFSSPKRIGSKRDYEQRVESLLNQEENRAALEGIFSVGEEEQLLRLMNDSGISDREAKDLLKSFEEEIRLRTSYRIRFLKILIYRTARQGKTLLMVPLADKNSGEIILNSSVLIQDLDRKKKEVRYWTAREGVLKESQKKISEFLRDFVRLELNDRQGF